MMYQKEEFLFYERKYRTEMETNHRRIWANKFKCQRFCHQKNISYVVFLRQRKNYQKSNQDTTIQFHPLMILPTPSELISFSCNGLELQMSKHDLPYILKAMQWLT